MDDEGHDIDAENEPAPPAALALGPGAVLNGIYRIDRFLTRGGMGDVYAGVNVETEEKVAIKAMLPRLAADPKILSLFRSEARTLIRVAHPAVAHYRVFARDPVLGVHYLVTDFIDGEALSSRLHGERPEAGAVTTLLRRLAGGLRVAHEIGAIHRDVAPDNILLPGGRIEAAKIIDFGIAKYVEPGDRTVVMEGFAGKLNYVAPEQFGLFGSRIGPWTDVYSTALTTLAFARAEAVDMGRTIADAVERRGRVPDLDGLPEPLRPLIGAMLTPDPRERVASMDVVLERLDRCETAQVVVKSNRIAKPLPAPRPVAGKRRLGKGVILGSLIALLAAAAILWLIATRGPAPRRSNPIEAYHPSVVVAAQTAVAPSAQAPTPPPASAPAAQPAAQPTVGSALTLSAQMIPRRPRASSRGCSAIDGTWVFATVSGLTAGRDAALVFLSPSGVAHLVFSGTAGLDADASRRHSLVRRDAPGSYRFLQCANGPGQVGFVLLDGARDIPTLAGGSARDVADRYRALAAQRGWIATETFVSVPPVTSPPLTIADSIASGDAIALPPSGFCRKYDNGEWRDIGVRKPDKCISAAFGHDGVGNAEFGGILLRGYGGRVEAREGRRWRPVAVSQ